MDLDVRNDFTQHNLSSILGAERHLRVGAGLPGGPQWTHARQSAFVPPGPRSVEDLLEPIRAIRGRHRWDAADDATNAVPSTLSTPEAP